MEFFKLFAVLIIVSSAFGYINVKFLKLPETIGLMVVAIVFSLLLIGLKFIHLPWAETASGLVARIDFETVLMDIMLSFLLFAGAMHTDLSLLRSEKNTIILFALVGVLVSTFAVGTLLYGATILVGYPVHYIHCLLFGALISPTDPIAVLGILSKLNVPEKIKINIVGESLFNDGVGVVVFTVISEIARSGLDGVHLDKIGLLFGQEVLGGLALGWCLGYLTFRLLKSIDHYQTEVMITIAIVAGGYYLAQLTHVSGPIAMVIAGLFTGSRVKEQAMSHLTEDYIEKFWEIIDVLMNAVLFVMIGLFITQLHYEYVYLWFGLLAIPLVLLGRYLSIRVPLLFSKRWVVLDKPSVKLLTWGGLRGGISIALALSLSPADGLPKDFIVFVTYTVVLFSIIVQGLSLEKIAKRLYPDN